MVNDFKGNNKPPSLNCVVNMLQIQNGPQNKVLIGYQNTLCRSKLGYRVGLKQH